jgi:hypothetical protein
MGLLIETGCPEYTCTIAAEQLLSYPYCIFNDKLETILIEVLLATELIKTSTCYFINPWGKKNNYVSNLIV